MFSIHIQLVQVAQAAGLRYTNNDKTPALYRRGKERRWRHGWGGRGALAAPCSMPAAGTAALRCRVWRWGLWHNFGSQDSFSAMRERCARRSTAASLILTFANNYGPVLGSAEENFGRILHGELAAYRDELIIATKAGYRMCPAPMAAAAAERPCWPA